MERKEERETKRKEERKTREKEERENERKEEKIMERKQLDRKSSINQLFNCQSDMIDGLNALITIH